MFRTFLVTASTAALLATGAMAQTTTPAPQQPASPAQARPATPASTEMGAHQMTTKRIVGITIYAPKPDQASTGTNAPLTTGSTMPGHMTVTPVSDEQWRTMRGHHDAIGKIEDLVIGTDGRISHAVLGVGGFLGIGEKNVALAIGDIRFMRQSDGTLVGFVTSTKKQLQDMPAFEAART